MSASSFSPLLRFAALVLVAATVTSAFVSNTPVSPRMTASSDSQLGMGMFDFIKGAFENEAYENRRVTASHILVESPEEAAVVAKSIQAGETTFSDAARDFSTCPSSKDGGSLGTFEPGSMLPEFEAVVFDEEKSPIGEIVGPVQTKFGYHLVRVDKRFLNQDRSEGSGFF